MTTSPLQDRSISMNRKLFWLISTFYFWFFAIIGVYVIYMPKVLELYGYSSFQIGVIFSMSPLMRFLTPFLFLRYFRLNKEVFLFSLAIATVAGLLFFITIDNFYLFLVPNILLGIAFALMLPFVETIALQKIGKEHYGKSRLFGSIGFILIALVLAHYMKNPYIALYLLFFTIIASVLAGFSIAKFQPEDKKEAKGDFSILRHWALWTNLFLMQVSFGPFYNFFTIYESQKGLEYTTISYLWTFGVIAEIVMLYFQTPLMKKNLLALLQLCSLITALRWLLLYLFPTNLFMLYFAQSLHAFSFALYYSAAISYLFQIYSNKTLAQQFFGGISFGLGGMAGSLLAGMLYGENLFLYASFIAFLSFLVIIFERDKRIASCSPH